MNLVQGLVEVKAICRFRKEYNVDDIYDDLFDAAGGDPPWTRKQLSRMLKLGGFSEPVKPKYIKRGRGNVTRSRKVMQYRFKEETR